MSRLNAPRRCAYNTGFIRVSENGSLDLIYRLPADREVINMSLKYIRISGAREHNLKNVSLEIPRDQLVVMTGLSGSGKSSLAFDTIFAEGQRKYMESLSTYST